MDKALQIIKKLQLSPHPEGGYYRQTYRCKNGILIDNDEQTRPYSTCIYYMLTKDDFSAFHRIKQDEIWHFYDGCPIKLHIISKEGKYDSHIIGKDIIKGESPQLVVEAGQWFAAELTPPDSYALVGCTVSPGFDFEDFELMDKHDGVIQHPQHKDIIERLSRD